jgi:predicted DNA binding CopG/RHH family protein
MKHTKLDREESVIESALLKGEYRPAAKAEFDSIAQAIARRKKDAVLNIRVNSTDLASIKQKAKKLGIPYQTLVSELLHHYAV